MPFHPIVTRHPIPLELNSAVNHHKGEGWREGYNGGGGIVSGPVDRKDTSVKRNMQTIVDHKHKHKRM